MDRLYRIEKGVKTLLALLLAAAFTLPFAASASAFRLSSAAKAEKDEDPTVYCAETDPEQSELHRGAQPKTLAMLKKAESVKAPPLTMDFSTIRVLITLGNTASIDLDLCCDYLLGDSTSVYASVDSPRLIEVAASGSMIRVSDRESGEILAEGETVDLRRFVQLYEAGWAQLTRCSNSDTLNRYYLGDFSFYAESGYVRMVNTVPMAYYLYGIIGYELAPSSQPEALKAQAVAAKAFGMYFIKTSQTARYDVEDGWKMSLYQAYRGFRENRMSTMPYCHDVIGETIAYNGKLIPAYYGHTDGGETQLPSQKFGAYEAQFDGAFENWLDDIEFDNYAYSKVLIKVTFGGRGDNSRFLDFILSMIRDEYGADAFNVVSIDELYTFEPLPGTQRNMQKLHVAATVEQNVTDEATQETVVTTASYTFECSPTLLRSYKLTDIDGSGDDYSTYKYVFTKNYELYWGKETAGGYTLIFSRHGNGIGLSQMGADVRANPKTFKQDYKQILAFYYPNMQIVNITERAPEEFDPPVPYKPEIAAYGVCSLAGTNFRSGPSTSYSVIGVVGKDEHIDILDVTESGWFRAIWNGHLGYISATRARATLFPSPKNGVFTLKDGATNCSCNFRSAPYIADETLIGKLSKGTAFTVWGRIGKWNFVITSDGQKGFLHDDVVDLGQAYTYTGTASLVIPAPRGGGMKKNVGEEPSPSPSPSPRFRTIRG